MIAEYMQTTWYSIWNKQYLMNENNLTVPGKYLRQIIYKTKVSSVTSALAFQYMNTLRPGDVYIHQWARSAFVQVMACHLFGTKPLSGPMLAHHLTGIYGNKFQWNLNKNTTNFFKQN